MHPRVRLVLIGFFACAFAALAGVWIAALHDRDAPAAPRGWSGALRPPGATVPALSLRDQDGRDVSLRGGLTVYAFVYSTCRDVCPLEVQQIRGALDELGRDVRVLAVSVDPANDTPARAKTFLIKQQMTGRMPFLLGTRAELAPVWRAFGIQPQTRALEHSAYVVVADATGRQRLGYPASELTPEGLARDLGRLG